MSIVAVLLLLGLAVQAEAATTNPEQGNKVGSSAVGTPAGNAVQTNEQNKVVNQGENTQIQTQEQNNVQTQDSAAADPTGNSSNGKAGSNPSAQVKSQVANAVQEMLQVADREGGIGQQVRAIAQTQSQNQEKLDQSIGKIQDRGSFVKFLIGPSYGEIKNAQKTLEQNKEQIQKLNQIKTQLSNQGDQQQLTAQIAVLEKANQTIETELANAQSGFSLFGWLSKLIS